MLFNYVERSAYTRSGSFSSKFFDQGLSGSCVSGTQMFLVSVRASFLLCTWKCMDIDFRTVFCTTRHVIRTFLQTSDQNLIPVNNINKYKTEMWSRWMINICFLFMFRLWLKTILMISSFIHLYTRDACLKMIIFFLLLIFRTISKKIATCLFSFPFYFCNRILEKKVHLQTNQR